MKKVLITGVTSYVGNSLAEWLGKDPDSYLIDKISLKNNSWREKDFTPYDVIVHVAGIAHRKETRKVAALNYKINRDLTFEVARKSKIDCVSQFIFLSSMSVYGVTEGVIDENTYLNPKSSYGISKLQGEERIKALEDGKFKLAILRPPMIYGKGSPGNYQRLAKFATNTPFFPNVKNKRSMIFIDNLCEYVRIIIENQKKGVFHPQNKEYVNTSELVQSIANRQNKSIKLTKIFNPIINKINISTVKKIFGDLIYAGSLTESQKLNFVDLETSIEMTEVASEKKVIILSNHHAYTYNFRREIIQALLDEGYKVYVVLPYGEKVELLKEMGCEFIDLPLDRRGINPIIDAKLLFNYYRVIKDIKPNAVLSYTVKPNVYGGIVSRLLKVPFFPNVTGLGTAVEKQSPLQRILVHLYRFAYKKASCVFFQNQENFDFFRGKIMKLKNSEVIPGSGVNIEYFQPIPYPENDYTEFVFISRIMQQKGIDQYLDAAKYIRKRYPKTIFHILGFCEEKYENQLNQLESQGIIQYHGMQQDVRPFLENSHCTIHPTYYPEGMSNVLLESAASGRPIITTDRSGCKEIVDDGINGFVVEQKHSEDLIEKIEMFLQLSHEEKKEMGLAGRRKVEKEFDRELIVEAYLKQIHNEVG